MLANSIKALDKRLQENEATCKAILSLVKKSQKKNIDQYKVRQAALSIITIMGYFTV